MGLMRIRLGHTFEAPGTAALVRAPAAALGSACWGSSPVQAVGCALAFPLLNSGQTLFLGLVCAEVLYGVFPWLAELSPLLPFPALIWEDAPGGHGSV